MPGTELFGAEERKEVNDVLETGVLFRYNHDAERKGMWKSREFEKQLVDFTGAKYAHAVSSGSAAVSTALAACGIGYGDEVIVPPFTYVATIEAVMLAGAIPVFAELDETICLSPEGIRAVLTPKTKAVLLVHMCGAIGRIEEIIQICEENNIKFIEDSAQALGASYKGKMAGTFGMMGCYSFDFFKIVTCGEGGIVVTNDEQLYKYADGFSDHGHDHIGNARGMEQHPHIGTNFRIGEMNAAVGVAQMRKLDFILKTQRKNQQIMKDVLSKYPQITFRYIPDESGDSATCLSFFGPDETVTRKIVKAFAENGIDACQYWYDNMFHYIRQWDQIRGMKSTYKMPVHVLEQPQDYANIKFPQSDDIVSRLISMIIKVNWTDEQIATRVKNLEKALDSVFELVSVK
jgi:8-amino-3,8-dideoxy-alpha-D-manno-octulosonate transaminase